MRNLQAEMKRYGVTNIDIQKVIGCSEKTVRNKLNSETDFTLPEAMKIRDNLFPSLRMEYLFAEDKSI